MQRREFLRLLAAAPLLAGLPLPALAAADWRRSLVLVELKGGNDGLNTVVPYADPTYYQARPHLAVARDQVLPLDERLGLNPALEALMPAWKGGELAWALGVGYARPNRSHFRSIEIWETAADAGEYLSDGWLTREFAANPPPRDFVTDGVVLGRSALGPLGGTHARALVMDDPERFARQAARIHGGDTHSDNPALAHILRVRAELESAARALAARPSPSLAVEFPKSAIGRQLQRAAELLVADPPAPVIKVSHGSFDTHANQRGRQDRLLKQLAEALAAFRLAMRAAGAWDRVVMLSYSEFGRRVAENASLGTDHGTAAPHFLLGGRVRGGLYGRQPSLADLDAGDLRFGLDYRQLYAAVVEGWWGLPGSELRRRGFEALRCFA